MFVALLADVVVSIDCFGMIVEEYWFRILMERHRLIDDEVD